MTEDDNVINGIDLNEDPSKTQLVECLSCGEKVVLENRWEIKDCPNCQEDVSVKEDHSNYSEESSH